MEFLAELLHSQLQLAALPLQVPARNNGVMAGCMLVIAEALESVCELSVCNS